MPHTLLAVDLSYHTYRAAAAHKMLTDGDIFTGGLYGFLTSVAKLVRETQATDLVICRDWKPYRRSITYPAYKQLRKKHQDEGLFSLYTESQPLVLDAIEHMSLPYMGVEGFESDDCIAHLVQKYRNRFDLIYAASNDSDLYQLFDCKNFRLVKNEVADCQDYRHLEKLGLTPTQFMLASALRGTHNDIEGIDGVGEITSAKAVKDPALLRRYREKHGALIERNLDLIKLPHAEFPRSLVLPRATTSFDARALYRFCSRYSIEVTRSMVDSFSQVMP